MSPQPSGERAGRGKKAKKKRRYGKAASRKVGGALHERKRGTLRSGRSKKKVRSREQAIAIGLSQARREGARVPARAKKTSKKARAKKTSKTARAKKTSKTARARKTAKKRGSRTGGR